MLVNEYDSKKAIELCYQTSCWLAVLLVFFIPLSTTAVSVLSIVYAFLILFSKKSKEITIFIKSPITLSVFLYIIINVLGTFYTTAETNDIYLTLKKTIRLALLPLLMAAFMQEKWQKRGIAAFIISITILAFYNYFLINYTQGFPEVKNRIYSSSFIAFGAFLLLFFPSQAHYEPWLKFLSYMLAVFLIYFLIFSNDSFTGQVIFFTLMTLLIKKRKKAPFGIIAFFLGLLIVFSSVNPHLLKRSSERLSIPVYSRCIRAFKDFKDYIQKIRETKKLPEANGSIDRVEFDARTLRLCLKKPFLGYGTGSFSTIYNAYYPPSPDRMLLRNPHNQYLLTFLELGIVGLLSLCFMFYMVLTYIRTINLNKPVLEQFPIEGVFYFMLVGCTINSWLLDFTSAYFFVAILAIFYAKPTYLNALYRSCSEQNNRFNNLLI